MLVGCTKAKKRAVRPRKEQFAIPSYSGDYLSYLSLFERDCLYYLLLPYMTCLILTPYHRVVDCKGRAIHGLIDLRCESRDGGDGSGRALQANPFRITAPQYVPTKLIQIQFSLTRASNGGVGQFDNLKSHKSCGRLCVLWIRSRNFVFVLVLGGALLSRLTLFYLFKKTQKCPRKSRSQSLLGVSQVPGSPQF